jgi:hypothetical protein
MERLTIYYKKRDLKELSKTELSKEMFGAGVYLGIQASMDSTRDIEKNKETEPSK